MFGDILFRSKRVPYAGLAIKKNIRGRPDSPLLCDINPRFGASGPLALITSRNAFRDTSNLSPPPDFSFRFFSRLLLVDLLVRLLVHLLVQCLALILRVLVDTLGPFTKSTIEVYSSRTTTSCIRWMRNYLRHLADLTSIVAVSAQVTVPKDV